MSQHPANPTARLFVAANRTPVSLPAAWLLAIRPPIVLICVLGVSTGFWKQATPAGLAASWAGWALAALGAACLGAGIMVHNDYTDAASDAVLKPFKPIPSGRIGAGTARAAGLGLMLLAIGLSGLTTLPVSGRLNLVAALLTTIVVLVAVYYNHAGKYHGLWGHAAVAFGVGAIPYWGGLAARPDDLTTLLPLALGILVMETGREILVCAGDVRGDRAASYRTLPILLGIRRAVYVAGLFYLGYVLLLPWPYLQRSYGRVYLLGALAFAAVLVFTWARVQQAAVRGDEALVERRCEVDVRMVTRLGVLLFQVVLLLDVLLYAH